MKRFSIILGFELNDILKNKTYRIVTIILMITGILVSAAPKLFARVFAPEDGPDRIAVEASALAEEDQKLLQSAFEKTFPFVQITMIEEKEDTIKAQIHDGTYDCAYVIDPDMNSYRYYVEDQPLYDESTDDVDQMLQEILVQKEMVDAGISPDKAEKILNIKPSHKTIDIGTDQETGFVYAYFLIMILYMVIAMYGQMIATHVAAEKDSRTMELLITSADPVSLMFGKVIASFLSALLQVSLTIISVMLSFRIFAGNSMQSRLIRSFMNIPTDFGIYMLLFFLLGFLLYSFLYAAVASTVSRTEDLSNAISPLMFLVIIGFMISMFSMASGKTDSMLVKIASYIPFTSPFAMFERICMSTVPLVSILISILILAGSTVLSGIVSARIYRAGVLLYGQKLSIIRMLKLVLKG